MINPNGITAYYLRYILGSINVHRKKSKQDICIFSNRRSGSTLLMQMIYSQPYVKYIDQPLSPGKYSPWEEIYKNIYASKLFSKDKYYLMRLENYFNDIIFNGKLNGFSQWNYFDDNYKLFSDRFVIKILNALPLIDWFNKKFNIKIIYLLRHPIPTSLSIMQRNWENIAEQLLSNQYFINTYLDKKIINFSLKILKYGTMLEKFVLEWCLCHHYPLLKVQKKEWLTITYEELLLRPKKMIDLLCNYLDLSNRDRMLETMLKPSKTTSRQSKKDIINKGPSYLIDKWKNIVNDNIECKVMNILEKFGIDAYKKGSIMATDKLIHYVSTKDNKI